MKIKNLLTAIAVVVLYTPVGYAQRVEVENGRVIINASEMPHTTTPKPNKTTATNTTSGTQDATDIASWVNNEKVYKRFEVSKTDYSGNNWREAVDLCADLTTDGGGWRLPTRRELMLMRVLKRELEAADGFTLFSDFDHWSATETYTSTTSGTNGDYVNVSSGKTYYSLKSGSRRVRCIKELP